MYDSYAAIYDLAGQGRFGEQMARWALGWLSERDKWPGRVLDLACGTGAAALVFARAGCEVVGVDTSAAMLDTARAKARDASLAAKFALGDMRYVTVDDGPWTVEEPAAHGLSSTVYRPFDLVTCFTDSLNYLTDDGDLERVFAGVAAVLPEGGWLVFDINTEAEYATWNERDVVAYDGPDLLLYQKLSYNRRTRTGTGHLGWFVREIDSWWRGEETHTQRAWSSRDIRAALDASGLEVVLAETPEGVLDERRMMYVARKPVQNK